MICEMCKAGGSSDKTEGKEVFHILCTHPATCPCQHREDAAFELHDQKVLMEGYSGLR